MSRTQRILVISTFGTTTNQYAPRTVSGAAGRRKNATFLHLMDLNPDATRNMLLRSWDIVHIGTATSIP